MSTNGLSPTLESIKFLEEKIQEINDKLSNEGVKNFRDYLPGVLAINMGIDLPDNAVLPEGKIDTQLHDKQAFEMKAKNSEMMTTCTTLYLQMSCTNHLIPMAPKAASQAQALKGQLREAISQAASHKFNTIHYNLSTTPVDRHAFYVKIAPLINELESLAEQYQDAKRAMATSYFV